MSSDFISINDAAAKYQISQNKVRKLVKENKGTKHVKTVGIKGKHGFKYLISVSYLDAIFYPTNEPSHQRAKPKQDINLDNQNNQNNNQLIIHQITSENKRLSNQIESQIKVIENLSNTIKDQNKVIISQSMQVHQLTERTTTEPTKIRTTEPQILTFENIMVFVLVCCMVAVIVYLFR